jgi:hypothetical protein
MMRWLVENTLEDFFRLVSESAGGNDRDADRQWPYRRAFWEAYLDGGHIVDAWVVLGEYVQRDAQRVFGNQGIGYGKLLRGYNVKHYHAVLILKIGDLVITEWSHMGKYRVWHDDNRNAPKFYLPEYTRNDLVTQPDFDGSHMGADYGKWQGNLANHVANWTGIAIHFNDYMPQ